MGQALGEIMVQITIDGELPSLNEYIKACRTNPLVGSRFIKKVEERLIPLFMWQTAERDIQGKVWIDYVYYCRNQKRDLDNIAGFAHKAIQDSLVKAGILVNDGWKQVAGFSDTFRVDKDNPHIEICLLPVAERGVSDAHRMD